MRKDGRRPAKGLVEGNVLGCGNEPFLKMSVRSESPLQDERGEKKDVRKKERRDEGKKKEGEEFHTSPRMTWVMFMRWSSTTHAK